MKKVTKEAVYETKKVLVSPEVTEEVGPGYMHVWFNGARWVDNSPFGADKVKDAALNGYEDKAIERGTRAQIWVYADETPAQAIARFNRLNRLS